MNTEELAFFNAQLGGMLRSGIPLEGAIRQLSGSMRRGLLRREMELLGADLAAGKPLGEALESRNVPAFYKQMIQLGAKGQDLPGALTQVADYYVRIHSLRTRLRGMLVYPALLLLASILLSGILATMAWLAYQEVGFLVEDWSMGQERLNHYLILFWMPPVAMLMLLVLGVFLFSMPSVRDWVRWKFPGVRDASLAQLGASLAALLRAGLTFQEAILFHHQLSASRRLRDELGVWRKVMASGKGRFHEMLPPSSVVPQVFAWVVGNSGEDLAKGFQQAADLFQTRSDYRYEMFLYCVMPVSIIVLGLMILGQVVIMAKLMMQVMNLMMAPF